MRSNRRLLCLVILCMIFLYKYSVEPAYASEVDTAASNVTSTTKAGTVCEVRFNGNGSNSDLAPITVTYGDTYGTLPELTRDNYVFQGWYTFARGGIKVEEKTPVIKPLSHTLYARWTGAPVEIELDANGGTVKKSTVTVYYGSKYRNQLPTPTKASYQFDGWYTEADGGEKITVKSIYKDDSPSTLYAHWTEKKVKVILIAYNGDFYELEVSYGQEYGELPTPEREGYIFGGWYKYQDYTNYLAEAITEETIVKETTRVKLFARWFVEAEQ